MKSILQFVAFSFVVGLISCEKEKAETITPVTPVNPCQPDHYCFSDDDGNLTVDYSGQTARLLQMSELALYMKTANTSGTSLSAEVMRDMFSNADGNGSEHFSEQASVAGKQLEDKCFIGRVDLYHEFFENLEQASLSVTAGSNGQPGVVTGLNDPSKKYLLDANGIEWAQIIEKGLMGDVFYYQASAVYLAGTESGAYNTAAPYNAGANQWYSEAEHKFDEAFGYLGAPANFPENTGDALFHGKYAVSRDAALDIINPIFNAFKDGRTAISSNDESQKLQACEDIRYHWSRIVGGTSLYYLKQAAANMEDPAIKCHALSEARAFISQLIHNSEYGLSPSQVDEVLELLGPNFYETTADDISAAQLYLITNGNISLEEFANL
jgi:hypothetical protein